MFSSICLFFFIVQSSLVLDMTLSQPRLSVSPNNQRAGEKQSFPHLICLDFHLNSLSL